MCSGSTGSVIGRTRRPTDDEQRAGDEETATRRPAIERDRTGGEREHAAPAARSTTFRRARSTRRRCRRPSSRAGAARDRGRATATPATATGNATAVSRITLTMNCGRVSSLPLGGGLRNQCTLVQPWPASQTRLGTSSAAAIATASGKPHERRTSRRQTRNAAISSTRTTASVYFVSSPIPAATPSSGHEPRPSASRSASQRTTIVVELVERDRLEEQVGPEHPRREPDHHGGERLRPARRPELASTRAPTSTVPALARIVIARRPTSDQPNSSRASAATSAVTGGNST